MDHKEHTQKHATGIKERSHHARNRLPKAHDFEDESRNDHYDKRSPKDSHKNP